MLAVVGTFRDLSPESTKCRQKDDLTPMSDIEGYFGLCSELGSDMLWRSELALARPKWISTCGEVC